MEDESKVAVERNKEKMLLINKERSLLREKSIQTIKDRQLQRITSQKQSKVKIKEILMSEPLYVKYQNEYEMFSKENAL
jgi:hypothetical protein